MAYNTHEPSSIIRGRTTNKCKSTHPLTHHARHGIHSAKLTGYRCRFGWPQPRSFSRRNHLVCPRRHCSRNCHSQAQRQKQLCSLCSTRRGSVHLVLGVATETCWSSWLTSEVAHAQNAALSLRPGVCADGQHDHHEIVLHDAHQYPHGSDCRSPLQSQRRTHGKEHPRQTWIVLPTNVLLVDACRSLDELGSPGA